jgi:hypothetical protein
MESFLGRVQSGWAQMEIVKRKPFGENNDLGDQNRFGGLNSQAKADIFISFEH